MRRWRRIEEGIATAKAWINFETRIRPARVEPQFYNFAIRIEKLIQLHLLPFMHAEVIAGRTVFTSKSKIRFADRLQPRAQHTPPLLVKNINHAIERRFRACGVDFDNPRNACSRVES